MKRGRATPSWKRWMAAGLVLSLALSVVSLPSGVLSQADDDSYVTGESDVDSPAPPPPAQDASVDPVLKKLEAEIAKTKAQANAELAAALEEKTAIAAEKAAAEARAAAAEKSIADLQAAKEAAEDAHRSATEEVEQLSLLKEELTAARAEAEVKAAKLDELVARKSDATETLADLEEKLTKYQEELSALKDSWLPHWVVEQYTVASEAAAPHIELVRTHSVKFAGVAADYAGQAYTTASTVSKPYLDKAYSAGLSKWKEYEPAVYEQLDKVQQATAPYTGPVYEYYTKAAEVAQPYWESAQTQAADLHARFLQTETGQLVDKHITETQNWVKQSLPADTHEKHVKLIVASLFAFPIVFVFYFAASLFGGSKKSKKAKASGYNGGYKKGGPSSATSASTGNSFSTISTATRRKTRASVV